jgi:hypothetical protein
MITEIEHPEIRYVVPSIHRTDGTLNGKPPKMRHDPDCTHYNFRGGKRWGTPELATEEQMRTLKACTTCVNKRAKSR